MNLNAKQFAAIICAAAMLGSSFVRAEPAEPPSNPPVLLDNIEDGAPRFRLLEAGVGARIAEQAVITGRSRWGSAAERIVFTAPAGNSAHLSYELPPSQVIPEQRLSAWVSCSRPGIQLAATVVLPRSIDPATGVPRTLCVRSGLTVGADEWQELKFENTLLAVQRHARVARAQYSSDIDEREAYVSQLVILAPGGPGSTEVLIDQVSLHGVLRQTTTAEPQVVVPVVAADPSLFEAPLPSATANPAPPAAPRIVQWQGEPFEFLQRIGFDGVWMARTPTPEEFAEVERLRMALICPPPTVEELERGPIGAEFDVVTAWDLGVLAEPAEVEGAQHWAQFIERRDPVRTRLAALRPLGMTREASRIGEMLVLGRPTVGATISQTDNAVWLNQQRRVARPGTPIWAAIETHGDKGYRSQLAALRGGAVGLVPASYAQLSQATTAALGILPRGFYFQSHASLAAPDAENRMRLLAVELTNLRLGLVQPWLAAGKSAGAARSNRDDLSALVLKAERSHLLIPLRWSDDRSSSHIASSASAPERASPPIIFVLPGVPESADAYVLSISGPQQLESRRITGGLEITVEHLPDDAFILLTEDGYAFSQVEHYLRQHAPRAAQARVELAALRRQLAARTLAELPPWVVESTAARADLARVDRSLAAVMATTTSRNYAAAFARAAEAEQLLEEMQLRLWSAIAPKLPLGANPLPVDWSTMGDCTAIALALAQRSEPPYLIAGGEFESLDEFTQAGWQRLERSVEGLHSTVRLSTEAPARGVSSIELEARPTTPGGPPPMASTTPVWITSPAMSTAPGHLVEISGLIRIPEIPLGSADPVLVFDSIGGEASALRIDEAPSWTPFRLVRAVPAGAECRVTIALGGAGRVQVDSLAYRLIPQPRGREIVPVASRVQDRTVR